MSSTEPKWEAIGVIGVVIAVTSTVMTCHVMTAQSVERSFNACVESGHMPHDCREATKTQPTGGR